MNNERWEPVAGHMHYDKFTVAYDGAYIEVPDIAVALPADLRLCRRVEATDDRITAEALEAEGWKPEQWKSGLCYIHSFEDGYIGVDVWTDIIYGDERMSVHLEIDDASKVLPNCTTMPQLRALVVMLSGGGE